MPGIRTAGGMVPTEQGSDVPLINLLNLPKNKTEWDIFAFSHRDSHTKIRQAIKANSGVITVIQMTSNGAGYTSAPDIIITDALGNGSGATATTSYVISDAGYSISPLITAGGNGYLEPVVSFSGGGGSGASALALATPVINLPDYVIDPIPDNDLKGWIERNQELHNDMNGQLGLQGSDLQDVDFDDQKQLQSWVYLHFIEHQSAEQTLGI